MNLFSIMLLTAETSDSMQTALEMSEQIAEYGPKEYLFTGFGMLAVFVVFMAPLFLAVIPARIAKNKGRNFAGYYLFGYFALIPAIIVVNILKPVEMKPEKERSMRDIANGRR